MKKKQILFYASFLADLTFLLLLVLASGWHWLLALTVVEALMGLARMSRRNPVLFRFVLRRLLHMLPILFAVIALGFLLMQLAPGDIFTQMVLNPDISEEDLERYRAAFKLDKPWYVQFFSYLWNILHGDFGFSIVYKIPAFSLISQRALNTLILSLATVLCAWGFSIPAGIYAARRQYSFGDQAISVFAFFGLAIPNFFLAFLLIFLVSKTGNWLPLGGMHAVNVGDMNIFQRFGDLLLHMIIPVFVLATSATASLTRIMRANMLDTLSQQYITTARAKGLSEHTVVYKHALRNAINPMISIFGLQFGAILGGAALVEQVTAWPGLGKLMLAALLSQDTFLITGSFFYGTILLVVGNLIADILLAVVDPRIRIN
ncbi:MAG: ABC transporter substrate-binding protein [Spirochaetales bacterium]|nr:MAG: ABC transporter substrate-binding protein [Spirochaetales bacterium]